MLPKKFSSPPLSWVGGFLRVTIFGGACWVPAACRHHPRTHVSEEAAAAWYIAQSVLSGIQTGMTLPPFTRPPQQFHADHMGQGLVSGKAPEGSGDLRPSLLLYFRRLEPSLTHFLTHFQELSSHQGQVLKTGGRVLSLYPQNVTWFHLLFEWKLKPKAVVLKQGWPALWPRPEVALTFGIKDVGAGMWILE